jgi:formylglycine-generating enzyme required for sulfatase activity
MTAHRLAYLAALAAVEFVVLAAVLHAAPQGPPAKPAAGEKGEEFEFIVNDTEKKTGMRRVLTLELGDAVTMDVVRIKAGKFTMGSPAGEKDRSDSEAEHEVTLTKDFYLGKFLVTQAQYEAVTGKNPSYFKGKQLPVGEVSWGEPVAFCKALGAKVKGAVELPSEAQWEYACRSGATTPFHFGSKLNGDRANHDGNYPYGTKVKGKHHAKTVDVGSYKPNGFGLYDMHGNLWEWCQDYYGPYDKIASTTNPIQLNKQSEDRRVLRGGSWANIAGTCRAAYRYNLAPGSFTRIGFRVCVRLD